MINQERLKEAKYAQRKADHEKNMMVSMEEITAIKSNSQPFMFKDEITFRDRLVTMGLNIDAETY